MIAFLSSLFEVINVVTPDPKIFLRIAASVAEAADINFDGIKALLAGGFSAFFIKDQPVFSSCPRILPKNPPD